MNWDRPSYHSTAKAVACNGIVYWLSPGGGGIKAYNLYDGPTDCCNVINCRVIGTWIVQMEDLITKQVCVICVKESYGM